VIAALVLHVLRHVPLFLVALVGAVLFIGSWIVWPLVVWAPVWALVMVAGLAIAAVFDLGEKGRDQ
jgi:hypothetical protein